MFLVDGNEFSAEIILIRSPDPKRINFVDYQTNHAIWGSDQEELLEECKAWIESNWGTISDGPVQVYSNPEVEKGRSFVSP
jgi:hypothetical protein